MRVQAATQIIEQMDPIELRERTRSEHAAVEASMPLMQDALSRELYVAVLRSLYPLVRGWEQWATDAAPERLRPLVQARRRASLLAEDIRFFGQQPPDDVVALIALDARLSETLPGSSAYDAVFLGAMYVIEGSTLGGQFIARHVEQIFDLAPGLGDSYFRAYANQTGPMWLEVKSHLVALDPDETDGVVDAAKAMFSLFQRQLDPAPAEIPAHAN